MAVNQGMKDLISLINAIQDAASGAGVSLGSFDLPQIAVVGGQSAGKSSVLETFVGRDFLPRGSGIVTRCPLVLQLIPSEREYAEFLHLPGKQITDLRQVREEIKQETIRIIGSGKAVSPVPINLHIYSPDVLELTLVDLPGMTKVPVDDQPADIEYQIRNMLQEFIRKDNTLILAVTPANQDLANSDALNLAREVDPEGNRTIGVITKLDLMDRGTDAREILENRVYPLARGYIGLVNRCQADIDINKDIRQAQEDEIEYLRTNKAYKHMADRMGSKYLQQVLNKQLSEHIRKSLPLLNSEIKKQHSTIKEELEKMNYFGRESDDWKHDHLMKLLQEFSEELKIDLEGHSVRIHLDGKLSGGAKIKECFYDDIQKLLDMPDVLNEQEIWILLQKLEGFKDNIFISGQAFEITVKQLVNRYKDPMIKAVDLVSAILSYTIAQCAAKLSDYPNLKEIVISKLSLRMKKQEDKTKRHMALYVDAQGVYMNTKHPDFERLNRYPPQPVVPPQPVAPLQPVVPPHYTLSKSNSIETIAAPYEITEPTTFGVPNRPTSPGPTTLTRAPSVLTLRSPTQAIQKGWILIDGSRLGRRKERWFTLASETLTWYKDEEEKEVVGTIDLEGLKLNKDSKSKRLVLSRSGKPINKDYPKMNLMFRRDADEDMWCNALKRIGVMVDLDNTSVHSHEEVQPTTFQMMSNDTFQTYYEQPAHGVIATAASSSSKSQFDREKREGANLIIRMVQNYMQIMDKLIRDIVPKYIVLFLIQAMLDYTHLTLIADVTKKDILELMEEGEEDATRKKQLLQMYEATEKAMDILSIVSFS